MPERKEMHRFSLHHTLALASMPIKKVVEKMPMGSPFAEPSSAPALVRSRIMLKMPANFVHHECPKPKPNYEGPCTCRKARCLTNDATHFTCTKATMKEPPWPQWCPK